MKCECCMDCYKIDCCDGRCNFEYEKCNMNKNNKLKGELIVKDVIHDCYIDKFDVAPSKERIEEILKTIPSDINLLAQEWGKWDTEIRENIFDFISK